MATNTTLLIGTIWATDDIEDVFVKKVGESEQFEHNTIKWTVLKPGYQFTEITTKNDLVILFHLHTYTRHSGIKCHKLEVQNCFKNKDVLNLFKEIGLAMGGLFEKEEDKGFISFPENYTEDLGFISRKKYLKIKLSF